MAKRFLICPGWIESTFDFQRHYVNGGKLIELYGLDVQDCVIRSDKAGAKYDEELMPLFPLKAGDYKDHLLRAKINDFARYVRACKLFEFHNSGASPKPKNMQKRLAEVNAKSMRWHEKHWPDFPAAYKRMLEQKHG